MDDMTVNPQKDNSQYRDLTILERIVCNSFPLDDETRERRAVLISEIHYNIHNEVVALSVYPTYDDEGNDDVALTSIAFKNSDYHDNIMGQPNHIVDTANEALIPIDAFDLNQPSLGILKEEFIPDIMARRFCALLKYFAKSAVSEKTKMDIAHSKTLRHNDRLCQHDIENVLERLDLFFLKSIYDI